MKVKPAVLVHFIARKPLQETQRKIPIIFHVQSKNPIIKAAQATQSSREESRRSNHRKPLLLRSPEPTHKARSGTVPADERRSPIPRRQPCGMCPILDNRRHPSVKVYRCPQVLLQSAGDVRGEHHLAVVPTLSCQWKAAEKRCRTREREEGTTTTNRRADTDETRKRTAWYQRTCVMRCAPRAVGALVGCVSVD